MRAVITVVGKDTVGILAKVSDICAKSNINITEVSQTVISKSSVEFTKFADELSAYGDENGLSIHAMHEDIFNSMHRI